MENVTAATPHCVSPSSCPSMVSLTSSEERRASVDAPAGGGDGGGQPSNTAAVAARTGSNKNLPPGEDPRNLTYKDSFHQGSEQDHYLLGSSIAAATPSSSEHIIPVRIVEEQDAQFLRTTNELVVPQAVRTTATLAFPFVSSVGVASGHSASPRDHRSCATTTVLSSDDIENQANVEHHSYPAEDQGSGDGSGQYTKKPEEQASVERTNRTKRQLALIATLCCVAALGVGLGVWILTRSHTDPSPKVKEWVLVGSRIDGQGDGWNLGSTVVLNQDATRLAVCAPNAFPPAQDGTNTTNSATTRGLVQVFALLGSPASAQLGQDIWGEAVELDSFNRSVPLSDTLPVTADMNAVGDVMVVGSPFHDVNDTFRNAGLAEVYKYDATAKRWIPVGNAVPGTTAGALFGASVAMNQEGFIFVIGAPGSNQNIGEVSVYQLVDHEWRRRGSPIQGTLADGRFGTSVSLSADGNRLAVGGRSNLELTQVVKIYTFDAFVSNEWQTLGSIDGGSTLASTGWYTSMSADGNRLVVSNSYINWEDGTINDQFNSLFVAIYNYEGKDGNGAPLWTQMGNILHTGAVGPKSGYFVSLSGDGKTILMGDPGTSSGGRNNGHAHVYKYENASGFVQKGANSYGIAAGDNFGYSVSISGSGLYFAVGAPYSRSGSRDSGSVSVFQFPT
jgi:FG-GAP repeat